MLLTFILCINETLLYAEADLKEAYTKAKAISINTLYCDKAKTQQVNRGGCKS